MTIPSFENTSLNFTYTLEYYKADSDKQIYSILAGDYDSDELIQDPNDPEVSSKNQSTWDLLDNTKYDIVVKGRFDDLGYTDPDNGDGAVDVNNNTIYLETLSTSLDFKNTIGTGTNIFDFTDATVEKNNKDSKSFNYGVYADFDIADKNVINFTGAVGDNLAESSAVAEGQTYELFTIKGASINKDNVEFGGKNLTKTTNKSTDMGEGFGFTSPFSQFIKANTDLYETNLSTRSDDNANIKSAFDLTGDATNTTTIGSGPTAFVEAKSNFVDLGTTLYTQRNIGSNDKTSLVRSGDTVTANAYWANVGSYGELLSEISINSKDSTQLIVEEGNALAFSGLDDDKFIDGLDVSNATYNGGVYTHADASTADNFKLTFDVTIKESVAAGTYLSDFGFYSLDSDNGEETVASKASANLVTFSGDLNYDGRVSLQDLAFLNAGVLAQTEDEDFGDVDANFDGKLNLADLAVLSEDFGKTLHDMDTDALNATTFAAINVKDLTSAVTSGLTVSHDDVNSLTYVNSSYDSAASLYDDLQVGLEGQFTPNDPAVSNSLLISSGLPEVGANDPNAGLG